MGDVTSRYLIVSNRLPITALVEDGKLELKASTGGLATALKQVFGDENAKWIGWPGETGGLLRKAREQLEDSLDAAGMVPVYLAAKQVERFYEGFSNGVLWPLFHYLLDTVRSDAGRDWEAYREVNEKFAEAVVAEYKPGDRIWVQDYQLCLVPGMLRKRLPHASIGFFLHIPFPASGVFRILPWRREILQGLLGADLIGFHTFSYARQFSSCLLRILGLESNVDTVTHEGRLVRIGAFPISIDTEHFESASAHPEVTAKAEEIRHHHPGCKILVGVDRLDYTKGLKRRVLAIEHLLEKHPELAGKFKFIQAAVPSRAGVEAYKQLRKQIDETVGRINGRFSTISWSPVQYLYRGLDGHELLGLYRAADVMLVTPLRDGMNLVAKEFVACRHDDDGVLVLSEFAGAAWEMGEAIIVNPYNEDELADAMHRALTMEEPERRFRMQRLRKRVRDWTVHEWVRQFDQALTLVTTENAAWHRTTSITEEVRKRIHTSKRLVLVLDYDGTLVPFASTPELAIPDPALLELLQKLTRRPGTEVHVASGRDRHTLEKWLGHLKLAIHAEHGFWSRARGSTEWAAAAKVTEGWREKARAIMEEFAARTPGALVEEKTASLCWHFRRCEPVFASMQERELRLHLAELFRNHAVEVLRGSKIVELRQIGVHKGLILSRLESSLEADTCLVAIGDDTTDEDMFANLSGQGIGIHVGARLSRAPFRLADPTAVRGFLASLVSTPPLVTGSASSRRDPAIVAGIP
ncbi:bifunctional alpha,alpha-trehalose-phosphate synthase (UDP-forming)/trehalose-phosphatase [Roseimicrobium sp. ORNL1]|uniref:bifunctional alpha,alpha-trehalose-phosphate synthase (UDP-forming)/trehalose-phosphatase n=1 Tax=Roseimicrobium sp. ORNL1 TaxID=2711231 RepID=UPI0013E1CAEB|nr:bifunctional alpha,alpha-trehalose-phosphate synthase (UDP-forming)/trehalose-phosphatase [Roseimicrobium sp. ORNL1]QIF05649.1 bifunctional alpha,alpha-trehalose-phosphate synthase (UDP-forming)/trehalose-phosphatase [Roseimicrobium sp. ORNL1]